MKRYFLLFFASFHLFALGDASSSIDQRLLESSRQVKDERHIVVVTCSYNNAAFYKWNLDSIFSQEYDNYHVIYVDDCSPDNTGSLVEAYVEENNMQDKFVIVKNEERVKALANLHKAIQMCKPTDIVVILDGDDQLAHSKVLQKINEVYSDPNVWLTYGQFKEHPSGRRGFCQPYPQSIIQKNRFRYHPPTPSHLRTFYAGLFQKIDINDLMFQDEFFSMTYDLAMMFPMIEMAGERHRFIPDILLNYNATNPINDHKVSKNLQRKFDLIIRARTTYKRLDTLF